MTRPLRLALLCLPLLFSPGCIAAVFGEMFTDPLGHHAAFERAQREYTRRVRWGDIEAAAAFVHPELRSAFLAAGTRFAGLRITDYEAGPSEYDKETRTADVRVTYTAYSSASMVETEVREHQHWEMLEKEWVVRPQLEEPQELAGRLH